MSKYKNDSVDDAIKSKFDMHTNLLEFVGYFAHDILKPEPFMRNKNPLTFWTDLFHKCEFGEEKKINKVHLVWGYAVRVAIFARKFKSLTQAEQEYIIAANDEKIKWRGDDMEDFYRIVAATQDYRELSIEQKSNYRKRCLMMASKFRQMYQ